MMKNYQLLVIDTFLEVAQKEDIVYDKEFLEILKKIRKHVKEGEDRYVLEEIKRIEKEKEEIKRKIENSIVDENKIKYMIKEINKIIYEIKDDEKTLKFIEEKFSPVLKRVKDNLNNLLENINSLEDDKVKKILDEITNNVRNSIENIKSSIEKEIKYDPKLRRLEYRLGAIVHNILSKVYEISSRIVDFVELKKSPQLLEENIKTLGSIFAQIISLSILKKLFEIKKEEEGGRYLTDWEKMICLLQSCFWWNVSYLIRNGKFFEEYNKMIEKLPYIPFSYFETSTEFPIILKFKNREKEGLIFTDLFIRYFPLKISFIVTKIGKKRRPIPTILDLITLEYKTKSKNNEEHDKYMVSINPFGYYYILFRDEKSKEIYNFPLQVPLREVEENKEGYVKICENCLYIARYFEDEKCRYCGEKLKIGKIYGYPIFDVKIQEFEESKVNGFGLLPIFAFLILRGSENTILLKEKDIKRKHIKVELRYPLIMPLISKALIFEPKLKKNLSKDEKEKLLHTLAHTLLKIIAKNVGLSTIHFFYHIDVEKGRIYIFERHQGGIGCLDKFYEEFKDKKDRLVEDIKNLLNCPYCGRENRDGCPFCIWVGWCNKGKNRQKDFVSRKLLKELIDKNMIEIF